MSTPNFPTPRRMNGRLYFVDREIENHKRALAGLPLLPDDPNAPIKLRPASEVAAEFGFGRRTLGRRIKPVLGIDSGAHGAVAVLRDGSLSDANGEAA